MGDSKLLSICIPSYNRPVELIRLLKSIDCPPDDIEVVICEDKSPKRDEIREAVASFSESVPYPIHYFENEVNCGYDRNLRQCINHAFGTWVMFMGDDDAFVSGQLGSYIEFLKKQNPEIGYILRSYQAVLSDGKIEKFRYFDTLREFEPGEETTALLYKRSVFISGFCFRREFILGQETDRFDGTLLYQLYIQSEICMNHRAAYYDVPFTQSLDEGTPYFGSSEAEKGLYTAGTITVDNSVNFMKSYFDITQYIDEKYGSHVTGKVRIDMSKYSYPVLSIQRKRGRKEFKEYARRLRALGYDATPYFNIYYLGLLIFGEKFCDSVIRLIKKRLGRVPKL